MRRASLFLGLWLSLVGAAFAFFTPPPPFPHAPGPWGTPTNIGTINGTGTTLAVTGATVPAGALIIVVVAEKATSGAVGSVTDSVSNSYSIAEDRIGTAIIFQIFYAYNVSALSSQSITYTLYNSSDDAVISAFYVTGEQTSSDPLDSAVGAQAGSGSGSASVTSGTPGVSNEFFVGAIGLESSTAFTQAAGWTTPPNSSGFGTTIFEAGGHLINSGLSPQTYAPTTSGAWAAAIAGFKPS